MTEELIEQAVMVCPQCEGEGSYADGLDEAACSTECTRCGGNGWIVNVAAMQPHIAAEREDAARRALEAAVVEVYSECAVAEMIAPIIRAIDPAQFREAGNGA